VVSAKTISLKPNLHFSIKAAKAVCNLPHYEEWTTKEIIDRQNWIEEQAMNILGIRQRKEHGTLFENKLDNKSTT